jgi:hypothetical protein
LDNDGDVDIVDVMSVAARWNTQPGDPRYDPTYDVNCDDKIDIVDVMLIAAKWGIDDEDPRWSDCPPVHPDCATPTSGPFTSAPKLSVTSISPKNRAHVGQRISVEVKNTGSSRYRRGGISIRSSSGLLREKYRSGRFSEKHR